MSNIVVGSAPLALSSSWFSPGERVTATTIAQAGNNMKKYDIFPHSNQLIPDFVILDTNIPDSVIQDTNIPESVIPDAD